MSDAAKRLILYMALAVLGLAIFGWYERGQGAHAVEAQARADSLAQQADSLRSAMAQRVAQFAQDSQQQAQNALESTRRLQTTTRKADSLERVLKSTPPVTARDTQALQVIAAKDSQLTAAQGVIQQDSVGIRQREARIFYWRDTVVVGLTKARDAAQSQLQAALKKSTRRWFFPCAAGPIAGNSRGVGLGLAVGVCIAF